MNRITTRQHLLGIASALLAATTQAQVAIPITNADFESGNPGELPSGWAASAGAMYRTDGLTTGTDPASAYRGDWFVSATWQAAGLASSPYPADQTMGIYQAVDLTGFATAIDAGDRSLALSFAYNDADGNDYGKIGYAFFDADNNPVGTPISFTTPGTGGGQWATHTLTRRVPTGARSVQLDLSAGSSGGGSARNINFDALSANLTAYTPPAPGDIVHGNLVMLQDNGGWCWYQDERSLVNPANGTLLFTSVGNADGFGGEPRDGDIDVNVFDFATGSRSHMQLANNPSFDRGDDHNVGALWQRPDGRYLVMHTGHNEGAGWNGVPNGSDTEPKTYYRISNNPNDGTSWRAEQAFVWPENDPSDPITNDVTYSNLHYLADEGTGDGRLYNIARGPDRTPGFIYSDDLGETWNYGGLLSKTAESAQQGQYSNGYFKYTSNDTDRIDFIATEHHPRNFNNSIYHGYIQGGKSYDSQGNVIDPDIFDLDAPAPDAFTRVWATSPVSGTSLHHAWTAEIERDDQGNLYGLVTSRYGTEQVDGQAGDADHRLFYVRFDAQSQAWSQTELGKMGGPLHAGEQDYTGLGAIDPNDPGTIYISTPFDPRDDAALDHHEIFKGVSGDHGATWAWTPVTENSTVDNLRPIIPDWEGEDRAVLWLRGAYPNQRRFDQSVVGIIERVGEQMGPVTYIDATPANTGLPGIGLLTIADGDAEAADGNWHDLAGVGNGGSVLASNGGGNEDATMIKTTLGIEDAGTYDLFVFFWADPVEDWRISAGLSASEMIVFQQDASQQAQPGDFAGEVRVVSELGAEFLYRGYVGRVEAAAGQQVSLYVNDLPGGSTLRTWYDGVGYALISAPALGDADGDGDVDNSDLQAAISNFTGPDGSGKTAGQGDTDGDGDVDNSDLQTSISNFTGPRLDASTVPEPSALGTLVVAGLLARRGASAPARVDPHGERTVDP